MQRMMGQEDVSALRTLADVVEPVKDYTRMNNLKGPWDFRAPLNRLVDAVDPESELGRRFGELVAKYAQSGYKDRAVDAQIRGFLAGWRDNDAKLHPVLWSLFAAASYRVSAPADTAAAISLRLQSNAPRSQ